MGPENLYFLKLLQAILKQPVFLFFFFFPLLQKAVLFPFGPWLGRELVKKLLSGCRERLREKPWHQGSAKGPLKEDWALEVPGCAWG